MSNIKLGDIYLSVVRQQRHTTLVSLRTVYVSSYLFGWDYNTISTTRLTFVSLLSGTWEMSTKLKQGIGHASYGLYSRQVTKTLPAPWLRTYQNFIVSHAKIPFLGLYHFCYDYPLTCKNAYQLPEYHDNFFCFFFVSLLCRLTAITTNIAPGIWSTDI